MVRIFHLPLGYHVLNYALLAASLALLHIDAIRSALGSMAYLLPLGSDAKNHSDDFYEELAPISWFLHVSTIMPNLESISACWKIASKSSDSRAKEVYSKMAVLYSISHVQAFFTIMSHALIHVDNHVEIGLLNVDYFLIRLVVFGFFSVMWTGFWSLIPLAFLILNDFLLLSNPAGIVVSNLALLTIITEKSLSVPFKISWTLLALVPAFFPDSSTDRGHALGAAMLAGPLFLIAFSLNRRLVEEEKKQE